MRTLRAFLIAPLAAPAWYFIQAAIGLWLDPDRRWALRQDGFSSLGVIMAFGAPIAYAAALLALWPAVWWLRNHSHQSAAFGCVVIGVSVGAAIAYVIEPSLRGELVSVPLSPVVGAECGAAAAIVFWLLARRLDVPHE